MRKIEGEAYKPMEPVECLTCGVLVLGVKGQTYMCVECMETLDKLRDNKEIDKEVKKD